MATLRSEFCITRGEGLFAHTKYCDLYIHCTAQAVAITMECARKILFFLAYYYFFKSHDFLLFEQLDWFSRKSDANVTIYPKMTLKVPKTRIAHFQSKFLGQNQKQMVHWCSTEMTSQANSQPRSHASKSLSSWCTTTPNGVIFTTSAPDHVTTSSFVHQVLSSTMTSKVVSTAIRLSCAVETSTTTNLQKTLVRL